MGLFYVVLSCFILTAGAKRLVSDNEAFLDFESAGDDDLVDLSPLFMGNRSAEMNTYQLGDRSLMKCCCEDGVCKLGNLTKPNSCDGSFSTRKRDGCGCLIEYGYQDFKKTGYKAEGKFEGRCLMPMKEAKKALGSEKKKIDVMEMVKTAKKTKFDGGCEIKYGECSTTCGRGTRQLESATKEGSSEKCPFKPAPTIRCEEVQGCKWQCEDSAPTCGWASKVKCSGETEEQCNLKAKLLKDFPDKTVFRFDQCYKECSKPEDALQTMCAVTANHLDEQYGNLQSLMSNTCLADPTDEDGPDVLAVMSQELAGGTMKKNIFSDYVYEYSLVGYTLVGTCSDKESAQNAVFVKNELTQHLYGDDIECVPVESKCDWTNCKGGMIMGVKTTSGKLVVANWHGARKGMVSDRRIGEFENIAHEIIKLPKYLNRKLVAWGGDVNVRAEFINFDNTDPTWKEPKTPAEIFAKTTGDFLGQEGWTVDMHLSGQVSRDPDKVKGIEELNLKQAAGLHGICPTYRKDPHPSKTEEEDKWDGTYTEGWLGKSKRYIKVNVTHYNIRCKGERDQIADETQVRDIEYLNSERMDGAKSRAPSYTERMFLSGELYENCGKVMKDVRNNQDDHDPIFVQCKLPFIPHMKSKFLTEN